MKGNLHVILASQSPRRKELLEREGIAFTVIPADIDETRHGDESPLDLVSRLATQKALSVAKGLREPANETVLAADTIVWKGSEIFGKPHDDAEAQSMLASLSGTTHHVSTGVCIVSGGQTTTFVETSDVTFRPLSPQEIAAYVESGECSDKAGAYAIQGGAHGFVERLRGDYDNVVGLPVTRIKEHLSRIEDPDMTCPIPVP